MRDTEIVLHQWGSVRGLVLAVALALSSSACKSEEPQAKAPTPSAGSPEAKAQPEPAEAGAEAEAGAGPAAEAELTVANDPERASKLTDLDAMCKALNHDYDDGTLTDYYAAVEPKSEWGKAQRAAGNESIKPGRLLETAINELSPGAKDPALTNCRVLLDYIDDVE